MSSDDHTTPIQGCIDRLQSRDRAARDELLVRASDRRPRAGWPPGQRRRGGQGTGGRGTGLAAAFAGQPGVEVTAVCDADEGRARRAADAVNKAANRAPRVFTDLRRLLDSWIARRCCSMSRRMRASSGEAQRRRCSGSIAKTTNLSRRRSPRRFTMRSHEAEVGQSSTRSVHTATTDIGSSSDQVAHKSGDRWLTAILPGNLRNSGREISAAVGN